ncbi:MAG TPA: DUF1549 domain-containing protein, partial [Chthonomonadaceae bacterium]|nr:DUF1549 domain-containing protein [Chthonomonadaceae bacterium]
MILQRWVKRSGRLGVRLLLALAMLIATGMGLSAQPGKGVGTATPSEKRSGSPTSEQGAEFFEKSIRPLLSEHCYQCHARANNMAMGGLQLDSRAAFDKGGKHGPLVQRAQSEKSLLLTAVSYQDKSLQMPPKGKLPDAQLALLRKWVMMGAPWGSNSSALPSPAAPFDIASRKQHWAWQPLKPATPPHVKNSAWVKTPVDAFVLAKLEANHLMPTPPADKRTLLRRVTYDLIGLPPTPAEMDAFLADNSPNAYEKVVERLLASPHYGERWARHWLDLVRYAETDGHEFDFDKPSPWEYRDYVIRAFNADIPYNQFVAEQVAGDLLSTPRLNPTDGGNESAIGTGFWWLGEGTHSPVDLQADEATRVDNQIDVFSKAFLGLSLGCARCHNHKFDAISTRDYYALWGFLKSSRYELTDVAAPVKREPTVRALRELQTQMEPLWIKSTAGNLSQALLGFRETLLAQRTERGTRTVNLKASSVPEAWAKYVHEVAAKDLNDPLYGWATLGEEKPDSLPGKRDALIRTLQAAADKAKQDAKSIEVFEDFRHPDYTGWFTTGEAFGAAPSRTALLVDSAKNRLTGVMGPGVADSGGVSGRFQGTLRSRTFTLAKGRIWLHMAGKDAQVNLIVDGFQRIRAPIYGGLNLHLDNPTTPTWMSIDVTKWIGQRAYLEFLDRGSGSLAVDRIVFSDGGPLPEAPNPLVIALLKDPAVNSAEALAGKLQALFQETDRLWATGKLAQDPDAEARLALLNWMLRNPALAPATASEMPLALRTLVEKRKVLEAALPEPRRVMAMVDGSPEDEPVHIRGNYKTLGENVPRRFLEAIAGAHQPVPPVGSGRLLLAQRLTDGSDPL